jgi:UDP-N-acetylglucosamine 1-carboxyvinyltransferase
MLGAMQRLAIRSSGPLCGEVAIGGAKNSMLKLMAATLLAPGHYELSNVPDISDVPVMAALLGAMGVRVERPEPDVLSIDVPDEVRPEAPYELAEQIRASINVLGPCLARCGRVSVGMPGGDDFGGRPIDMHVAALEAMGAHVELRHGDLEATAPSGLVGAEITFEFPSVGATENVVMAAVGAKGETVLDNAAREPEIVDLCRFLQAMGADIEGVGSPTLRIHGVPVGDLHAVDHRVVPDRIEAATYLAAVGVAGGEVFLRGAVTGHMEMLVRKLREMGMTVTDACDGVWVSAVDRLRAVDVATLPYPGVATDVKPVLTAMLSLADGVGIVTENLFAGRFRYVGELVRLGADIRTDAHHAVVRGRPRLSGAPVRAHDIRAGASLVVAALGAEGTTVISDAHHLDRGYEHIADKLRALGADVDAD